jgi:hypothetical protein
MKVRQKTAAHRKPGAEADELDSPVWFAYKPFLFQHDGYHPRATVNTEVSLGKILLITLKTFNSRHKY